MCWPSVVIQSMSLAQIAFLLRFIRIYFIFGTDIPTSFASAPPPPRSLPRILKEYTLRQEWAAMSVQKHL